MRCIISFFILALLLGGCYSKQVRHLASDAALIKPGVSTKSDVRRFLGKPDGRRTISPDVVEYVYYEELPSMFGRTPVIGSLADAAGYEMIVVSLNNDVVVSCEFRTYSEKDREWFDDFTWEEVQ
ncbi:MAG: hypothetical protein CSA33_04120 [Desulfobulbus propionicus]|nr:MAG: hypothetical protein CSA33_04120 [Desulfobulbus propionicus]